VASFAPAMGVRYRSAAGSLRWVPSYAPPPLALRLGMAACSTAADNVQPERGTEASVQDPGTDAHVDPGAEASTEAGPLVGPEASGVGRRRRRSQRDGRRWLSRAGRRGIRGHVDLARLQRSRPASTAGIRSGTSKPSIPQAHSPTWCSPIPPAGSTNGRGARGVSILGTTYVPPFASRLGLR